MNKTQTEIVMAYITAHPGATYRQILDATGCQVTTTNTLLGQQYRRGKLLRSGVKGDFSYIVAPGNEVHGWVDEEQVESDVHFGCANPLTRLFNECLAGVRA
ncbi:hypothetical protein RJ492_004112 [Pluralibacter gergoviae]|uniref:Uncharacterized protein n=1 Tax=Pluralibacter gergoviae TaxID=61647 RepID=A0AAI9GNG8_PLUGE|nr:hypothetical protein [Pluralibacter gergoviae]EKV9910094.1 hypothetical protein [Pluralibacter gergoviae]EKW7274999.1 hypothetical protein [Pluralibacter gergoviae]ELD4297399.1 hypothetical protein [Pluralibacter gergoviae]ELD4308146.1 hypothetical protein [Pluralibacter gergoviae]